VGVQVALQAEANMGGFVAQVNRSVLEMVLQLIQAGEQPLQRGPASEIDDFTCLLIEGRAVVLGIVDIEADVEYVLGMRGRLYLLSTVNPLLRNIWTGLKMGTPQAVRKSLTGWH
jgi:hypothetical protein